MTDPLAQPHGAPIVKAESTGPASGLRYLRDGVAKAFAEAGAPVVVAPVGLKYRGFGLNQGPSGGNRIVFIPGEFDGKSGPQQPRRYGTVSRQGRNACSVQNPREIASWERVFTVSIWAGPIPGAGNDEGQSGEQAELLLELFIRALHTVATPEGVPVIASLLFGDLTLVAPPTDNSFGAELLLTMTQVTPIFGVTHEYVQAKFSPTQTLT